MSEPLQIHDGERLRPLEAAQDLRYDMAELLDGPGGDDRLLYTAERDLLTRARLALERPAHRASWHGAELELGREDLIVLAVALDTVGRLRHRRLETLAEAHDA